MRMIGQLENEASARMLGDYLYAEGIDNQVEPERDGSYALWIHSEDQLDAARNHLGAFRSNPGDPKYQAAMVLARERQEKEKRAEETARRKVFDRERIFPGGTGRIGLLTGILIFLCVAVDILGFVNPAIEQWLYITEYVVDGDYIKWLPGLVEVSRGQVWRLVTPILMHVGFVHLLFNMLWLYDLGTMVERRQSLWILLALVIGIAIPSNLAQFLMPGNGPNFCGMSGVVYGLIGYIWLRGRFDPASGLFLHSTTVTMAIIWYFLCLFQLIPGVANTVHTVGLIVGLACGYVSAWWANR